MKRRRSEIHVVYRKKNRDARDEQFPWRVLAIRLYNDEGEECSADQLHVEGLPLNVLAMFRTKALAVAEGVDAAKQWQPSTLKIHKRDGRIQEERTYPRSSDPKRSKG